MHHPVSSGAERLRLSLCKLLQPRDCRSTEGRQVFYDIEELCQCFLPCSCTGEKLLLSSSFGVLFQHVQFVFLSWLKWLWSGTRYFTAAVFVCIQTGFSRTMLSSQRQRSPYSFSSTCLLLFLSSAIVRTPTRAEVTTVRRTHKHREGLNGSHCLQNHCFTRVWKGLSVVALVHLTGAAQHGSVMVPRAALSFFAIPFYLCLKVSLNCALQCMGLISFCVFPLLWGKGDDFCSPMAILGKRLQTVVTSLSLQWDDAQIPWRYHENVERRWCCIHSFCQKNSPHDHLQMSLEVFDRHTVMICLEHYHGNTNSFISFMCIVPIGPAAIAVQSWVLIGYLKIHNVWIIVALHANSLKN